MKQLLLGGLIVLGFTANDTASAEERAAWIAASQSEDAITLEAHARLENGESGRYNLTVRKSGTSGTSTTRQGGSIPAGDSQAETGALMTSRLSFRSGESLDAELIVETSTGRKIHDVLTLTKEQ